MGDLYQVLQLPMRLARVDRGCAAETLGCIFSSGAEATFSTAYCWTSRSISIHFSWTAEHHDATVHDVSRVVSAGGGNCPELRCCWRRVYCVARRTSW